MFLALTLSVAFFTLLERKILAAMQRRAGPSAVGPAGLLQAIADGLKLVFKESLRPSSSDKIFFIAAPIFTFVMSLLAWIIIPFGPGLVVVDLNVGYLYLLALSSISVYGIIFAGWSSNSRYAFLGALRSSAQMISYELSVGFMLLTIFMCCGSLNLNSIIYAQSAGYWYFFLNWPILIGFFVCALAETSRPPFDLPEAESELVSGYNVEYSAVMFALFFLAEYCHILTMSALISIIFFGGYLPIWPFTTPHFFWLILKLCFFVFIFVWVRATLPRFRYDQLMKLGWKIILPFSLLWFIFIAILLFVFGFEPPVGGFTAVHTVFSQ
jgi:NADH-quinone oxidoreductase subunit H